MLHYYNVKSQATTLHLLQTIFKKRMMISTLLIVATTYKNKKKKKIEEIRDDKHIYGATSC